MMKRIPESALAIRTVVDELAKVRIASADSGILFIICFRLRRWRSLEFGRHRCGEIVQDARIKLRGWQRAEHAPKAALELVRSAVRLQAANLSVTPHKFAVSRCHRSFWHMRHPSLEKSSH